MKYLVFFTVILVSVLFLGCKKTTEPATSQSQAHAQTVTPAVAADINSSAKEQKFCPVMGGAINKKYSTQYKGKTVYFCCPGCKEPFEKEPQKYIGKLPQFN